MLRIPQLITPIVCPFNLMAAACAIASIPKAKPLTIDIVLAELMAEIIIQLTFYHNSLHSENQQQLVMYSCVNRL